MRLLLVLLFCAVVCRHVCDAGFIRFHFPANACLFSPDGALIPLPPPPLIRTLRRIT